MIGIYVLLLLAMLLIVKFCKNKIKFILGTIIIIITIYCIILNIDMNRVKTLRTPIFAKENGHIGSMVRYDGLGYKIGLEKDKYSNVTAGQLTILDWYLVQANSKIDYDTTTIDENSNNSESSEMFKAKILENADESNAILVEVLNDTNLFKKGENVKVNISNYEYTNISYIKNMIVNIVFDGKMTKSIPPQITSSNIFLDIDDYSNDYELSFYPEDNSEITEILKLEDYSVKTFGGDVNIIVDGDMVYQLKDALEQNIITADQILDKAKRDADEGKIKFNMYKEGGSTEYYYDNYTILKKNSTDGDKDLIIGNKGPIITDYNRSNMKIEDETQTEFTCEVIEVERNNIIVKPDENCNEAKNNDKIIINTSNFNSEFLVGDKLKITYDGMILETYPAQIYADKIEYVK